MRVTGCRPLRAKLGGTPVGYLLAPIVRFTSGWVLSWLSRCTSLMLKLTDMLSWSRRQRTGSGRKWGHLLLAGLIQTSGCAVPGCFFNQGQKLPLRRRQGFDWDAHTGAMFRPELEAHLYHSCWCALFTSGQSETTNKGLRPWEVPSAYISRAFCFPAISVFRDENKDLKKMLLPKGKNPEAQADSRWTDRRLCFKDEQERSQKIPHKTI